MAIAGRIIGLDPGLRVTGWGIVDCAGSRLVWVADGIVRSDDRLDLAARLAQLQRGLAAVIGDYQPAAAAVEETFVNRNPVSTLKLGQARGAVLAAVGQAALPLAEYAPNRVKKTVVGVGHADKDQVGMMIRRLLPGCLAGSPDAADALAVAVCHAHFGQARRLEALAAP